jgi:murein DD-endopeptidase MepM/ murein hydrolase activator NlpD
MQRADHKIKSLTRAKKKSRRQATAAARRLRAVSKRQKRLEKRLAVAFDRAHEAALDRDRTLRVHPNPLGRQIADAPKLRKRVLMLQAKANVVERQVRRLRSKEHHAKSVMRSRSKAVARIKKRVARKTQKRERAEQALGANIKRMVELAQASASASFRLTRTGFRRPARGYVSQAYGRNHDGIDIATRRGARVSASASGYVAYVGWNPWDERKRAYIVIIGHAGGYETIYAHLLPVRVVRPGQRVKRGQTIGRAGSTGHSSGPHVHWEVSRGFRTMNPARVGR